MKKNNAHLALNSFERLHWLHWCVVAVSLGLTLTAWWVYKNQADNKVKLQFTKESSQLVELLSERMQKYEDGLWGGVSAIQAFPEEFTNKQWSIFSRSLNIDVKYPGINGIGVIFNVPQAKLNSFLKRQRLSRPNFKNYPLHTKDIYLPITYIEPVDKNLRALGLDMSHEKNRYQAAMKARDTGSAQITGPIILVQDAKKTPGFLLFTPFYKSGMNTQNRKEKFAGLVYAPFVVENLMAGTLRKETRHIGVKITDQNTTLYNEHITENSKFDSKPLFTRKVELKIYGRTWAFDLRSDKSFKEISKNNQPKIILIGGLLIDILLLLLFLALTKSNKKALQHAKAMDEYANIQSENALSSAKMAALGEMASGVAHEINNPLAVISGHALKVKKLLEKENLQNATVFETLSKINKTVLRIAKIVRGMNSLTRDSTIDPFESVSIATVMEDSLDLCYGKFKNAGIELKVININEQHLIECRRIELSQVFINLLNNSFDAVKTLKNPWIRIEAFYESSLLKIEFSDSGSGISPENQMKILDPFFTTKKIGEGTGLGLSISKTILEHHNGKLYLDKECKNTKFIIEIPTRSDLDLNKKEVA